MKKIIGCMFGLLAQATGNPIVMTVDEIILGWIGWGVTIGIIFLTYKIVKHYLT